ncbi:MAG: phosphoglycerate dehydrogenase [Pirellulaceae bacterium]
MPTVQINPETMLNKPDAPYARLLREAGFDVVYPQNPQFARGGCSEEETIEELRGIHAVIATGEYYTDAVLAGCPELRVVARAGVGYDRVDVPAATRHNVAVTITPTANHEAVAELALALLLAAAKRIVPNDRATRGGEWPRTPLHPLRTRTVGIFGLGRIGRSLAVRCQALGMTVIATEQFPQQEFVAKHGIELVDFDALLARSDFLSVHCPLTDETRGLFNAAAFAKMKPDATFINTARGPLVCETDLHAALTSGRLRAAALDVFEQEPPSADNPLFQLDNVTVAPHIAGADDLSLERMGVEAAECIVALHAGRWPEGAVVNDELKGSWKW